jgi:uncharacterized protein (DUF983 family)
MREIRNVGAAVRRGFVGHCPRCGEGRLFDGYLALSVRCERCGEPLAEYRAADGPAFFTMTIVSLDTSLVSGVPSLKEALSNTPCPKHSHVKKVFGRARSVLKRRQA